MIRLLDCTKELAQKFKDTFEGYDFKTDYNLENGLYNVVFDEKYYTFNMTIHSQFISITRVPMAGDTCDDTMVTMSFDTKDFWKLEVF